MLIEQQQCRKAGLQALPKNLAQNLADAKLTAYLN